MGNLVVAKYETDAGVSIANNKLTIVDYEDLIFDPLSSVTTGAAWKYTAIHEGYYYCTAHLVFLVSVGWIVDESLYLTLYKNGGRESFLYYNDHMVSGGSNLNARAGGSDLVQLNVGDFVDFRVFQDSGGAIDLSTNEDYNYCSIFKV